MFAVNVAAEITVEEEKGKHKHAVRIQFYALLPKTGSNGQRCNPSTYFKIHRFAATLHVSVTDVLLIYSILVLLLFWLSATVPNAFCFYALLGEFLRINV